MPTKAELKAYSLSAAAREISCSPTQIARLIEQGDLVETEVVVGSGRYVTAESVQTYKRKKQEEA